MPMPELRGLRRYSAIGGLLLCLLVASNGLRAQSGLRIIELDFSGAARATVVLFERQNRPGEYLIAESDIPPGILVEGALSELPRVSEAGCNACIPVAALGGIQFNERNATGNLQLFPRLLAPQTFRLGSGARRGEVQRRPGLMLNWGLRAAQRDFDESGERFNNEAADAEVIASLGPAGVLRSDGAWIDGAGWRRGSTALDFFSVEHRFQFSVGDTVSASGPLSSGLRLGGLSLRRRFDAQSGRIFTPAYDLSTVSSLPGVAELYIDGERRRRQRVNAGEVTFEDIQGNNGSNVTLRFIDEIGAVQEVSTQLLGITRMIGQGEWDYNFTAGALRQGENDYADPGAAGNIRFGVTNWLNLEVFAEGVENQYNSAAGLVLALPFATIDITGSRNHYPQDVDDPLPFEEGEAYTWSITNTAASRFARIRFGYEGRASHNFRRLRQSELLQDFQRAFVGSYFGRFGFTLAANRVDDINTYSASASTRLGQFVLSASVSAVERGGEAGSITLSWSPRGDRLLRQTSASLGRSDTLDSAGVSASFVSAEQRAIADFRAEQVQTRDEPRQRETFGQARISKRWRPVSASYSFREDDTARSQNIRAEGGIAFTGLAPKLVERINSNDGYMVVQSALPGVRIDYGGYNIGTDKKGRAALVTRGFSPTRYQVDLGSLPDGYSFSRNIESVAVVPGGRAVSELSFSAPGFLLTVKGASDGDLVEWNGKAYPVFGVGAYIDESRLGTNELTWAGKHYTVTLPAIGSDIPEFQFDPATGKLTKRGR